MSLPKDERDRPRPVAPDGDRYLTTGEVAAALCVSVEQVRRLYRAKKIPAYSFNTHTYWILRSDVESYRRACRLEAGAGRKAR